jgi:hypothetical protein
MNADQHCNLNDAEYIPTLHHNLRCIAALRYCYQQYVEYIATQQLTTRQQQHVGLSQPHRTSTQWVHISGSALLSMARWSHLLQQQTLNTSQHTSSNKDVEYINTPKNNNMLNTSQQYHRQHNVRVTITPVLPFADFSEDFGCPQSYQGRQTLKKKEKEGKEKRQGEAERKEKKEKKRRIRIRNLMDVQ